MLVAKGRRIEVVLVDGRRLRAPMGWEMLHDDSGDAWPPCSLLITAYRKGRRAARNPPSDAKQWLGKSYHAHLGSVRLPAVDLSSWRVGGYVDELFYTRTGLRAPGPFVHAFNKPRGIWHIVFRLKGGASRVTLYQSSRAWRLDLPENCLVTGAGIIYP